MLLDFLQFLLFAMPLLVWWRQGRLKLWFQLPPAQPFQKRWRPVVAVVLLLSLYLFFGWTSYLAEVGWEGVLRAQGQL